MRKITDLKEYLSNIPDGDKVYGFLTGITKDTPKGIRVFNDRLYVNVVSVETKKGFDGIFERHRRYTDLQVVISGEERIYYSDDEAVDIIEAYDEKREYELARAKTYDHVDYTVMQGIELPVGELHWGNGCVTAPQKILKAIIKIKND